MAGLHAFPQEVSECMYVKRTVSEAPWGLWYIGGAGKGGLGHNAVRVVTEQLQKWYLHRTREARFLQKVAGARGAYFLSFHDVPTEACR